MKIYCHADDAGISRNATSQIMYAWEQGYLNGFSIIANKQCYDLLEQAFERNKDKEVNVSVHLNLTDGKCHNPGSVNTILADADGNFKLTFARAFFAVFARKKSKLSDLVYAEWDEQIKSIKTILKDKDVFALDSHNHIHLLPFYFKEFLKLSEKHKIERLRIADELFHFSSVSDFFKIYFWKNVVKLFIVKMLLFEIRRRKYVFNKKSDVLTGVLFSGHMQKGNVFSYLTKVKKRGFDSVEIIFHPGRVLETEFADLKITTSASLFFKDKWRDRELETVKSVAEEFFKSA